MERDDRSPVATFLADAPPRVGETTTLGEEAAHHARVKRLEVGDAIRLVDGKGHVGLGAIDAIRKGSVDVGVTQAESIPSQPAIHLRVPVGDRDRMLWLAEKATELGVATWQAVRYRRSASVSPRGDGAAFAEKVRARMVSALEQSGGAWLPTLLPDATVENIARTPGDLPLMLDVGGDALATIGGLSAMANPVITFGPEGGLEAQERDALIAAGWRPVSLATNTLRFETAGIAAVAVCRNLLMLGRPD